MKELDVLLLDKICGGKGKKGGSGRRAAVSASRTIGPGRDSSSSAGVAKNSASAPAAGASRQ